MKPDGAPDHDVELISRLPQFSPAIDRPKGSIFAAKSLLYRCILDPDNKVGCECDGTLRAVCDCLSNLPDDVSGKIKRACAEDGRFRVMRMVNY